MGEKPSLNLTVLTLLLCCLATPAAAATFNVNSNADLLDTNTGDGVAVSEKSTVQLGEDSGLTIFDAANASAGNNGDAGIRCADSGLADGRFGTLNGNGGIKIFAFGCIDSLQP